MNKQQASELIQKTFPVAFDKARFRTFAVNLLNHVDEEKAFARNASYIKDAFRAHVQRFERLGTFTSPDKQAVDVLIVYLTAESKLERARTAIRNFVADHLKDRDNKDAALVAFVSPTEKQWRLSYVKMEYATVEKDSGKIGVEERLTPARRFSYLVGEGESCHTAQTRFLSLLQDTDTDPALSQIEEAFSVEAVTKEFFGRYAALFEEIHEALEKRAQKDKTVRDEFKVKGVNTVDFAKKLMGQIVFLYFLQKKGWLGVERGSDWGDGPRDFLRQMANGKYGKYGNFFNDILEPLFYDTLATDRGHDAWCNRFKCRIPFLNGGLFEPISDYDWKKTDIILPNELFTNDEVVEEGVVGTGVLDVFDRYNFTVNESEPLEKEVAIDPEMLGQVFENLIEDNRRKGLGAFYTPREIVHYMCQESLINHLDTAVNGPTAAPAAPRATAQGGLFGAEPVQLALPAEGRQGLVPRADIETFVHLGEQISHYESVKTAYAIKMPKSIEKNAKVLDDALRDITVCDPAVGSGAFPVGMMNEIVRARAALTSYFNDVGERTPYHFKRHAIQNCLYGVDIDAGAVEIAKLRLWLSLVVDEEDVKQIKPLPNLDYKIVVGNSLMGFPFKSSRVQKIEALKVDFFNETNAVKKRQLKNRIDVEITAAFASSKKSLGCDVSFDFEIYFSEVFHKRQGFDVVIANPPYIFARESAKKGMTDADKKFFYANYKLAEYQVNLYPLFVEKGTRILRPHGALCFITPNNWLTINTNKGMRKFILEKSDVVIVNFFARVFESADVDSAIVVFRNSNLNPIVRLYEYLETFCFIREAHCDFFLGQREHIINIESLKAGGATELIQKIEAKSVRLYEKSDIKVGLGAYGLGRGEPPQTEKMIENRIYHATHKATQHHFKYVEGRDVCRYYIGWSGEYLKYGNHLREPRKDWRLFSSERILVRQIPSKPPYCIHASFTSETFLNDRNSMNIINIREKPEYVLGVLNSRLISWWFVHKFGKMQRGIFPQFKANELADFPLPKDPAKHRDEIAKLAEKILLAKKKDPDAKTASFDQQIDRLVYDVYDLTPEEIKIVEGEA